MRGRVWSRLAALGAGASVMVTTVGALASSGLDSPESDVEHIGRGNAWVARATNPLAAYYNPAAIAFQPSGVHLGALAMFANKCYTRSTIDPATGQEVGVPPDQGVPAPLLPGQADPGDGSKLPSATTCAKFGFFPNPQIGGVFRITDKLAVGLAVIAPHSVGKADWGESLDYTNRFMAATTMPAPQRYMLVKSDAIILNTTLSIAYAPTEYLSFGAGFTWGIATADFVNFSEAVSPKPAMGDYGDHSRNDVRAELKAKDLFIPGFVISGLWLAHPTLDVTAWFKWQDAIKGSGDLALESLYWKTSGARNTDACAAPLKAGCNITDAPAAGTFKLPIPMEAKLGLRYHLPRADQSNKPAWASKPGRKVRDPLSEDWFDVEMDFTWANNSAVQDLELTFHPGIVIQDGTPAGVGQVPKNGNIPHMWKDVFGVRLGGDFVAVPNRLTLRTGGFYEMKGQDDKYLQLDFNLGWKAGVGGGATVRVGPVDLTVGYQHTFYGTMDNHGQGAIYALSGDASGTSGTDPVCGKDANNPKIGPGCFRSWQAINGGRVTQSMNEVGLSATARF